MKKLIILLNAVICFVLGPMAQITFIEVTGKGGKHIKTIVGPSVETAMQRLAQAWLSTERKDGNFTEMWSVWEDLLRETFPAAAKVRKLEAGYEHMSLYPDICGLFHEKNTRWCLMSLYDNDKRLSFEPHLYANYGGDIREFENPNFLRTWNEHPPENRFVSKTVMGYLNVSV